MGWYLGHFHYLLFMYIAAGSIPVQTSVLRVFSSLLELLVHIPGSSAIKNSPAMPETQETRMLSMRREMPWRRKWQLTPVFLPGALHGQRSLRHYCPWGCKESDMTEHTHTHTHTLTRPNSLRHCHALSHSDCTVLHSHQQQMRVRVHHLGFLVVLPFQFFGWVTEVWDLSSPTRDWTQVHGSEGPES